MLTNGRVLSRAAYAEAVVRLGLDEIVVRVHGADAARADGATGVPGSFRQA
ncbi:radical SAM protein, partial [bacterium CG17_big_fil_post_rev_8_21_14_2_50_64_8]